MGELSPQSPHFQVRNRGFQLKGIQTYVSNEVMIHNAYRAGNVHLGEMHYLQSEKFGDKGVWGQISLVQKILHCTNRIIKLTAFVRASAQQLNEMVSHEI
jgi:hypothetical protein